MQNLEGFPVLRCYIYLSFLSFSKFSFWSSAIILLILAMVLIDIMASVPLLTISLWNLYFYANTLVVCLTLTKSNLQGIMAILKIQLNAVSVVNLVMSVGIAVEFCVHITHAFTVSCHSLLSSDHLIQCLEAMTWIEVKIS